MPHTGQSGVRVEALVSDIEVLIGFKALIRLHIIRDR